MKGRRSFLQLILALLIVGNASAAPIEVQPEVGAFQKAIETTLNDNLRVYLGQGVSFATHVYARIAAPAPLTRSTPPADKAAVYDVGYVSVPFSLEPEEQSESEDEQLEKNSAFALDGLDVILLVPDSLSETTITGAKALAQELLKPYRPTIAVEKVPAPVAETNLFKRYQMLIIPFTALAIALILLVGFALVSAGIHKGARSVADGIRVIFGNPLSNGASPNAAKAPDAPDKEDEKEPLLQDPEFLKFQIREIPRQLKFLKEVLRENPILFQECLGEHDLDWRGVRWLLSRLEIAEQEQLIRFLDPERRTLVQSKPGLLPSDTSEWLQHLVERLALKRIQSKSDIRQALGAERVAKLCQTTTQNLIDATRALNSPASWRLLSEFAPAQRFAEILGTLPPEQWIVMADSANTPSEDLARAADQILTHIDQHLKEPDDVVRRKQFLNTKLLEGVVRTIKTQRPGEDDRTLEELSRQAPDFADMIRSKLWTIRMLDRVPDAAILQVLKQYDYERRVGIIANLPAEKSQRVLAIIPEGNMRTIVVDMVASVKRRNDPEELRKGDRFIHELLSELQRQFEAGRFQLMDEAKGAPLRVA